MPNEPSLDTQALRDSVQAEIDRLKENTAVTPPTHDYEQLDGTVPASLPDEIVQPPSSPRPRIWPWAAAVVAAAVLVVVGVASVGQSYVRPALTPPEGPAPIKVATLNDVQFNAWNVRWDPTARTLTLALSVQNQSPRDLMFTLRGAALEDQSGKSYYPDLKQGDLPPEFFGRPIPPGTSYTARLVFADLPDADRPLTLVVRNVSDSYHFAWNYLLTLPSPEVAVAHSGQ